MRYYYITIYNDNGNIIAEYTAKAKSACLAVIDILEEHQPILKDNDRILVQYSAPI